MLDHSLQKKKKLSGNIRNYKIDTLSKNYSENCQTKIMRNHELKNNKKKLNNFKNWKTYKRQFEVLKLKKERKAHI